MQPENRTRVSNQKSERGNVLVYTVMSAFFLFMAVGLGVDLSHLYLAKTELQNAADASALAGASALKLSTTDKIPTAVSRATNIMGVNKYNFNNRALTDPPLIEFAKNLNDTNYKTADAMTAQEKADARFIRVTTPSVSVTTFFAIPFLGLSKNLTAKATAGLSVPGNVSACVTPLSAVSCPPSNPNCSLCPSFDANGVCTEPKYYGNCGGANPNAPIPVTVNGPDDPDGDGMCDPKREFCKGCSYNIRSGSQNGQGPAAGNFQVLRCAGNGANAVKNALAAYGTNCTCGQVSPGGAIETQTGELAGAVKAGLNVRFDDYGGGLNYGTDMPPDTNIAEGGSHGNGNNEWFDGISWGQYQGTGTPAVTPVGPSNTHLGVPNRRVLIVPIIPFTEFSNGNTIVHMTSLKGFFMRAEVSDGTGGDIQVEYISDDVTGVVGFDPNNTQSINVVTPVLYR